MIEMIEPELLDDSSLFSNNNILIPIQDNINMDIDSQKKSNNLAKKKKDYIKEKKNSFLPIMKAFILIIFFSKIN